MRHFSIFIFIPLLTLIGSPERPADDGSCRREKFTTPEPGTCLKPNVYRFLRAIDKLADNPVDSKAGKRIVDLFEPKMERVEFLNYPSGDTTLPLRVYYPNKSNKTSEPPILLYIHGGGFIAGTLDEYDMTIKKLAKVTEAIVVAPEYRLAPEHPFPAAVNDAYASWRWVLENEDLVGSDSENIFISGSSAGGNLATVVTLMCRDSSLRMPTGQLLFYPPTTFNETPFPSRRYFMGNPDQSYLLTEAFIRRSKTDYLSGYSDILNPYISPLEASIDMSLPPALIQTAQCDPLRDEARIYAENLQQGSVDARYIEYPGMIHGFLSFWMFFNEGKTAMMESKRFMEEIGRKGS